MNHRSVAGILIVIALGWLAPVPASGQGQAQSAAETSPTWTPPRTADGRPDLQGFWTTQTFTPLERPDYLGDKAYYTEEEWAALQAQLTADGADPLARGSINIEDAQAREAALDQTVRDATYVHYDNAIWLATNVPKGLSTRRTSLITDPPNGKLPPRTPEASQRAAAARDARWQRGAFDGYETRPLGERCIVYGHNGPPILPPSYNDVHQILQTPDHVVVFTEMTNNSPRIIPFRRAPIHLGPDSTIPWRLSWPLGRRYVRGRVEELQRQETLPGLDLRAGGRGTFHACRGRQDPLRVHSHRSDLLDGSVERGDSDGQGRGPDVRVCVSRRQSRPPPHPRDLPQHREASVQRRLTARLEVARHNTNHRRTRTPR